MPRNSYSVQTCTHCDKTGHNKRRCPLLSAKKTMVSAPPPAMISIKKKRQAPTCGLCGTFGHNKSMCVGQAVEFFDTHEDAGDKTVLSPKKRVEKSLFVNVRAGDVASPHVVNLRPLAKKNAEVKIPVYQEKSRTAPKREVVNIAAEVEKANAGYRGLAKASPQEVIAAKRAYLGKSSPERFSAVRKISENVSRIKLNQAKIAADAVAALVRGVIGWRPPRAFRIGAFIMMLCLVLPFPALGYYKKLRATGLQIMAESTNAFVSLQSSTAAAFAADLGQARTDLDTAVRSFAAADSLLEQDHEILLFIAKAMPIIGNEVASRQHLLSGGHHVALGNTYLVEGIEEITRAESLPLSDRIDILRSYLVSAIPQYESALLEFKGVKAGTVPAEYQQSFQDFQLLFATFIDDMKDVVDFSDALALLFGDDQFRRYLVLFQNPHEIRPTGGFMGSFAVVDVQKGRILNIEIPKGGTYDVQGQLTEYVKPPLPLQVLNKRWEFQDANWFPDFPASAAKAAWFYQHSRGTTVDGVFAVNATVLERILKVTGPLEIPARQLAVDHANVLAELEQEINADDTNAPKAVLSDLAPALMEKLASSDTRGLLELFSELNSALAQKEIQAYSADDRVLNHLRSFGWTGSIATPASSQDYLMVVQTNLHGEKSDARIRQTIEHQAVVEEDGSILNTVVVRREHSGVPGERLYGAPNMSYTRVYVPAGSVLMDAGGFVHPEEIAFQTPEEWYAEDEHLLAAERSANFDEKTGTRVVAEFGKTSFGNWTLTLPGETSEAYFVYRLPFRMVSDQSRITDKNSWAGFLSKRASHPAGRYSLLIQKQSGVDSVFDSTIIFPDGWTPVWKSSDDVNLALNGATVGGVLNADKVFGIVMEKREGN